MCKEYEEKQKESDLLNTKQRTEWKARNRAQASWEQAQCSPQSHSPYIEATVTEGVIKRHSLERSYFKLPQKLMFGVRGPHNFQHYKKIHPRTISQVPNF